MCETLLTALSWWYSKAGVQCFSEGNPTAPPSLAPCKGCSGFKCTRPQASLDGEWSETTSIGRYPATLPTTLAHTRPHPGCQTKALFCKPPPQPVCSFPTVPGPCCWRAKSCTKTSVPPLPTSDDALALPSEPWRFRCRSSWGGAASDGHGSSINAQLMASLLPSSKGGTWAMGRTFGSLSSAWGARLQCRSV